MKPWDTRKTWTAAAFAAIAAVVGVTSPAAAADQSTTTLLVSPTTAVAGSPVQLTARVFCPGEPGGGIGLGVTFFDGGDILATQPVVANGFASYVARFASSGTHTITAAYNGNVNCFASNAEATLTVTPAEYCAYGTDPCRDGQKRPAGSHECPSRRSVPAIDQAARPSGSPGRCRSW
ncbi:Ig-like domain-containing protein [Actinacidiphila glaucinigra]|uniref:Ig-like domain-containing protein n=1 Tax=Actinacidiphila glaucinigra TaxID=235986 RepID=UPI00366CD836